LYFYNSIVISVFWHRFWHFCRITSSIVVKCHTNIVVLSGYLVIAERHTSFLCGWKCTGMSYFEISHIRWSFIWNARISFLILGTRNLLIDRLWHILLRLRNKQVKHPMLSGRKASHSTQTCCLSNNMWENREITTTILKEFCDGWFMQDENKRHIELKGCHGHYVVSV